MKVKVVLCYFCKCGNVFHPHKGIRLKHIHGRGKPAGYSIVGKIEFCCKEMERAYDERFIQFETIMNHDRPSMYAVPIGCGLVIVRTRCFPECTSEDKMYIRFCPFCGKDIEIEGIK